MDHRVMPCIKLNNQRMQATISKVLPTTIVSLPHSVLAIVELHPLFIRMMHFGLSDIHFLKNWQLNILQITVILLIVRFGNRPN
jgi:hypothetical protein